MHPDLHYMDDKIILMTLSLLVFILPPITISLSDSVEIHLPESSIYNPKGFKIKVYFLPVMCYFKRTKNNMSVSIL